MSKMYGISAGTSICLKTAGKYCPEDLIVSCTPNLSDKLPSIISRTVLEVTEEDLLGATYIGAHAFRGCYQLNRVILSSNIRGVDEYAFCACSALSFVDLGEGVELVDSNSFQSCPKLKTVFFGSKVKVIGSYAFSQCGVEYLSLPEALIEIRANAFSGSGVRGDLIIPNSVKTIGDNAFYQCSNIRTLSIGECVETIGFAAFYNDFIIERVVVNAVTPPEIKSNTFSGVPETCPFYVPRASLAAYKSATNWSLRADHYFAKEDLPSD